MITRNASLVFRQGTLKEKRMRWQEKGSANFETAHPAFQFRTSHPRDLTLIDPKSKGVSGLTLNGNTSIGQTRCALSSTTTTRSSNITNIHNHDQR
jgi:hypothetical protein